VVREPPLHDPPSIAIAGSHPGGGKRLTRRREDAKRGTGRMGSRSFLALKPLAASRLRVRKKKRGSREDAKTQRGDRGRVGPGERGFVGAVREPPLQARRGSLGARASDVRCPKPAPQRPAPAGLESCPPRGHFPRDRKHAGAGGPRTQAWTSLVLALCWFLCQVRIDRVRLIVGILVAPPRTVREPPRGNRQGLNRSAPSSQRPSGCSHEEDCLHLLQHEG
jgi:hypothetical protein